MSLWVPVCEPTYKSFLLLYFSQKKIGLLCNENYQWNSFATRFSHIKFSEINLFWEYLEFSRNTVWQVLLVCMNLCPQCASTVLAVDPVQLCFLQDQTSMKKMLNNWKCMTIKNFEFRQDRHLSVYLL